MNCLYKMFMFGFWFCLLTVPVQAYETEKTEGVFCDTEAQLEQFAAYYDGDSIGDALEQVELTAPRACGLISAAVIRGRQMKDIRIKQGTLHLYEVLVVGMWNGEWHAIEPTVQYSAVLEKEEIASVGTLSKNIAV
jgi:hypothetical protein